MKNGKWKALVLVAVSYPLFALSCGADFRNSIYAGWLDFVTGSTTDTLTVLVPVADAAGGG